MVKYSTSIALLAAAALSPAVAADDDKRALSASDPYTSSQFPLCSQFGFTAIQCKDYIDETIQFAFTDDDRFIRVHIARGDSTRDNEEDWYEVVAIPMDISNDQVTGRDGDGIIHYDFMWEGCGWARSTAFSVKGSSKRLRNGRWFGPWDCSGKTGFECCADIKADVASAGHDRAVHCFLDYDENTGDCPEGPKRKRMTLAHKVIIFPDANEMVTGIPELHIGGDPLDIIAGDYDYWRSPWVKWPHCEDDPAWSTRIGRNRLLQPKYKSCSWFTARHKMAPWRCARRRGTDGKMANEACLASCKTQWMTKDGSLGCPG